MKSKFLYKLGLIISICFLYLALKGTNYSAVLKILSEVKLIYALPVAALSILLVVLKAFRWKMVLDRFEVVPYKRLLSISMIANMFNVIFPFRAGEVFQIFITKSRVNVKFGRSIIAGTIVLNKFFELLSLLILFYILTWFVVIPSSWVVPIRYLVIFSIIFLLLFTFNIINLKKVLTPRNRFLRAAYDFLLSLKLLEDKILLIKALFISLFIWSIELLMISLLFVAFNLSLPFWVSIFVLVSINLAMLIPATNASFGPYEYAIIIVLTTYKVSKETALSFAVTFHFLEIFLILLIGFWFYLKMKRTSNSLNSIDKNSTPKHS